MTEPGSGSAGAAPTGCSPERAGRHRAGFLHLFAGLVSESGVSGVVLISGLVFIVADQEDVGAGDALLKVVATSIVFWAAHVYAGAVSHLGDHPDAANPARERLAGALRYSVDHSWGLLVATVAPALILTLGALGLLGLQVAIWLTLWTDVVILAILGYIGVSTWTTRRGWRLLSALATALLGVVMIVLKASIH
jgi:hypothetical protein